MTTQDVKALMFGIILGCGIWLPVTAYLHLTTFPILIGGFCIGFTTTAVGRLMIPQLKTP